MRGRIARPIVIAAGGTGGHLFPAEALAEALIARGHRVALMTDQRTARLQGRFFEGRECVVLDGAGLAGRGRWRALKACFRLLRGLWQARQAMASMKPAAVVAFGGYPSVAPVLASRLLGRRPPVILHEQNAVLGRANRFLSRFADLLALGFKATDGVPTTVETIAVGNPVRQAVRAAYLPYAPPDDGGINLLVVGGSLGASVFSDVLPAAIRKLPVGLRGRLRLTQQVRAEDVDKVKAAYAALGVNADLAPFFADIAPRLAAAHLVVARAGASTVAELLFMAKPSILVPLPGAIDDHQQHNAAFLAERGCAWIIPQSCLTADVLATQLQTLLSNPETLAKAAAACVQNAPGDVAQTFAGLVEARLLQDMHV